MFCFSHTNATLFRCVTCKYEMEGEDLEDWPYVRLEDPTHCLHGVVHANGYGHLLRVNGREGGSKYLTGCDIMGFWDRICKMLHVRYGKSYNYCAFLVISMVHCRGLPSIATFFCDILALDHYLICYQNARCSYCTINLYNKNLYAFYCQSLIRVLL